VALLVCGLSACSNLRDESVAIEYKPESSPVAVVPGAEKVEVYLVGVDKRVERTNNVATKEGIFAAQVSASNDVVEVVRSAVEQGIKSEGFVIGGGGPVITVEVQNVHNAYRPDGFSNATRANVAFTLRVKNAIGATLYSSFYEGSGKTSYFIDESADEAKASLEQALAVAIRLVTTDNALSAALLSSGRSE
jgi:uncharacterized lipoprotein YajG